MKFILSIIALCAIQATYAQKIITKSYPASRTSDISVDTKYADIELVSFSGNEIIIEATVNINNNKDNDSYYFETTTRGNIFHISSEFDSNKIPLRKFLKNEEENTKIISTDNISPEVSTSTSNNYNNYGYQIDITLRIKIPENRSVIIRTIYGELRASGKYNNIKVNITYGYIEILQSNVSSTSKIELHSTYGHVDYTVPKSADMQFDLSTSYGEILTDLDVVSNNKSTFVGIECNTGRGGKYTLNKGKVPAKITATYNDIYLRGN